MTAVFHYLLFIWLCCPFVLHLVELSSQLLTTDKASAQSLPKIKPPKGFEQQKDVCYWKVIGQSFFFLVCFIWKRSFVHFAQIPELDFFFMIQRSVWVLDHTLHVSKLDILLTMLFNIWNGRMLTWMFLIFPWKLFQFCVFLHHKKAEYGILRWMNCSVLPRERSNWDQIAVVTLVWTSHSHFSASHSQWTATYPSCQVVAPALQGAKPLVLIQEST